MAKRTLRRTDCSLCGCGIPVKEIDTATAKRRGYDSSYDGEYSEGTCPVCAGYRTTVYTDDTRGTEGR